MKGTLGERIRRWVCNMIGHSSYMDGSGNEICSRCLALISTTYSREREASK